MHECPAGTGTALSTRRRAVRRALAHGLAAMALLAPAACGGASSLGSPAASGASSLGSSLGSGSLGASSLGSALPSASTAASALSGGGGASGLTAAAQPAMSALTSAASSAASSLAAPAGTRAVEVRLTAAAGANASASGQGAPVVVRIYQLGSTAAFDKAEFFRLLNADAATVGADLIAKDEVLVAPGATRQQSLVLTDKVRAIGLFAAFRDFPRKAWRLAVPVPAGSAATVPVAVTAAGLAAGA
jgi:type VI secretion system protein VasD